jgi:hypothetical protein
VGYADDAMFAEVVPLGLHPLPVGTPGRTTRSDQRADRSPPRENAGEKRIGKTEGKKKRRIVL